VASEGLLASADPFDGADYFVLEQPSGFDGEADSVAEVIDGWMEKLPRSRYELACNDASAMKSELDAAEPFTVVGHRKSEVEDRDALSNEALTRVLAALRDVVEEHGYVVSVTRVECDVETQVDRWLDAILRTSKPPTEETRRVLSSDQVFDRMLRFYGLAREQETTS
jgi:hypothetical protein